MNKDELGHKRGTNRCPKCGRPSLASEVCEKCKTPTLTQLIADHRAKLLAELAICDAATAGPWREGTYNVWQDDKLIPVCEMRHRSYKDGGVEQMLVACDTKEAMQADSTFIATARTALPDRIRENLRMLEALEQIHNEMTKPIMHTSLLSLNAACKETQNALRAILTPKEGA